MVLCVASFTRVHVARIDENTTDARPERRNFERKTFPGVIVAARLAGPLFRAYRSDSVYVPFSRLAYRRQFLVSTNSSKLNAIYRRIVLFVFGIKYHFPFPVCVGSKRKI